jgi:hypothetical protein
MGDPVSDNLANVPITREGEGSEILSESTICHLALAARTLYGFEDVPPIPAEGEVSVDMIDRRNEHSRNVALRTGLESSEERRDIVVTREYKGAVKGTLIINDAGLENIHDAESFIEFEVNPATGMLRVCNLKITPTGKLDEHVKRIADGMILAAKRMKESDEKQAKLHIAQIELASPLTKDDIDDETVRSVVEAVSKTLDPASSCDDVSEITGLQVQGGNIGLRGKYVNVVISDRRYHGFPQTLSAGSTLREDGTLHGFHAVMIINEIRLVTVRNANLAFIYDPDANIINVDLVGRDSIPWDEAHKPAELNTIAWEIAKGMRLQRARSYHHL